MIGGSKSLLKHKYEGPPGGPGLTEGLSVGDSVRLGQAIGRYGA